MMSCNGRGLFLSRQARIFYHSGKETNTESYWLVCEAHSIDIGDKSWFDCWRIVAKLVSLSGLYRLQVTA